MAAKKATARKPSISLDEACRIYERTAPTRRIIHPPHDMDMWRFTGASWQRIYSAHSSPAAERMTNDRFTTEDQRNAQTNLIALGKSFQRMYQEQYNDSDENYYRGATPPEGMPE